MISDDIVLETEYQIKSEKADVFPARLEAIIEQTLGLPGFVSADMYAAPDESAYSSFVVKYVLSDQQSLDGYFSEHFENQSDLLTKEYGDAVMINNRVLATKFSRSDKTCTNCGLAANYQYCANCGQRNESRILSIWSLIAELFGGLFNWDARIWRTLRPLIARPGFLTNEYLSGKRVHYTPPLRMYLVLSVLFFLTSNFLFKDSDDNEELTSNATVVTENANSGGDTSENNVNISCDLTEDSPTVNLPYFDNEKLNASIKESCLELSTPQGREVFATKFVDQIPLLLLALLPLLALASKIFYPFSKRYYVEHLLFFIHYHAFLFCLVLAVGFIHLGFKIIDLKILKWILYYAAFAYAVYYFYRMLRQCFRSERKATLLRLPLYAGVYFIFTSILLILGILSAAFL